ncbi:MAG: bifunctional metallophosphatase/5'-nucleotidase [Elusimicrobiota bacterium]|jgi:2',3'-cyclic-nucleotide 2'-phosphodiesterase (5'-nucleotidase family)|nr:bifunctional metallophosphatase/5'-nucleotidase [Elusimicrobiota bacterium]
MPVLKKICAALLLLPLAAAGFCTAVNIYHTGDTHGYYYARPDGGGSFALLAAYLRAENAPCRLLLDSGDFTSGTYEAERTKGLLSVRLMNMLGYNAAAIGNHEGDFGRAVLEANIAAADFDMLAANMRGAGVPAKVQAYKIYEVCGKKIAVIGIAKDPMLSSAGIKTGADITALKTALAAAKEQKPDAVILLAHTSAEDERDKKARNFAAAAAKAGGIDIMLGGHVHKIVQNKKIKNTVFVESGAELKGFSKVVLDFDDKNGRLASARSRYIELKAGKYAPDSAVAAYAAKFHAADLDKVLAKALKDIPNRPTGGLGDMDTPMGNLFTDIMRAQTGADIALHGNLRAGIPKGPVTKRLLFEIYPFPSRIIIVKTNGAFIKRFLLKTLKNDRSQFSHSGLSVKYAFVNKKTRLLEVLINGKPLDDDKTYSVAVSDFTAGGQGAAGYMFKRLPDKKNYGNKTLGGFFAEYFERNPADIMPPQTGRIQIVKETDK